MLVCPARLFRCIDRWKVSDDHHERLGALGLPLLRFHDSHRHWAVENLRAGVPVELVARQPGHRDATMVLNVYGRFIPTTWNGAIGESGWPSCRSRSWGALVPPMVPRACLRRPAKTMKPPQHLKRARF